MENYKPVSLHAAVDPEEIEGQLEADHHGWAQEVKQYEKPLRDLAAGKYALTETLEKELVEARKNEEKAFGKVQESMIAHLTELTTESIKKQGVEITEEITAAVKSDLMETFGDMISQQASAAPETGRPSISFHTLEAGESEPEFVKHQQIAARSNDGRPTYALYASTRAPQDLQATAVITPPTGSPSAADMAFTYRREGSPTSPYARRITMSTPLFTLPFVDQAVAVVKGRATGVPLVTAAQSATAYAAARAHQGSKTLAAETWESYNILRMTVADDIPGLLQAEMEDHLLELYSNFGAHVVEVCKAATSSPSSTTGAANAWGTGTGVIFSNWIGSLKGYQRNGAVVQMSEDAEIQINALFSSSGAAVDPRIGITTILGYPKVINSHFEAAGTSSNGNLVGVFASWSRYLVEAMHDTVEVKSYTETSPNDYTIVGTLRAVAGIRDQNAGARLVVGA